MVPVKNLGELRWYGGCHYTREREMGTLTISQKTLADELVKKKLNFQLQQRSRAQQQQQQRGPRQQQSSPWASWESPPAQQRYRSGVPHQRRQQHQGRGQPRWQRTTCQRCGEDEHFPTECRAAPRAPAPQHRQYTALSYSGAHAD